MVFLDEKCGLDFDTLDFSGKKDVNSLSKEDWNEIESDTYWCLTRLLDSVLDNYTNKYPGV